ncbi:MAG: non-canonical purine NTP pyrophosphatase, partial [Candidatus Saccharimonadales bacterium]|nr:non-canonical purine NTP pyrophosphatase [Candidatus Saccharimonadales bacterium]
MDKLIFATNNPGKLEEISKFGAQHNIEVIGLTDAGISGLNPKETGATFKENADIKLRATLERVSEISVWVAADDSGIMIDALNGEPGVRSRRWNGTNMTDQEIVDYTLERLRGVPYEQRGAKFKSV